MISTSTEIVFSRPGNIRFAGHASKPRTEVMLHPTGEAHYSYTERLVPVGPFFSVRVFGVNNALIDCWYLID